MICWNFLRCWFSTPSTAPKQALNVVNANFSLAHDGLSPLCAMNPNTKNNWLLHIKTDLSNVRSSNTIVLTIANATEGACSCSLRAALLSIVFKACKIVSNSYLNANNVTKCARAHCTSNLLVFNWARTWIARAKFEVPHMTSCNWVILYYLTSFQPSTYTSVGQHAEWSMLFFQLFLDDNTQSCHPFQSEVLRHQQDTTPLATA